jgi:hypothetical protein
MPIRPAILSYHNLLWYESFTTTGTCQHVKLPCAKLEKLCRLIRRNTCVAGRIYVRTLL